MMYSEFVENTGCKNNEHNRKVFADLEVLYMNSDISKAEIYEYGKKLVDNSKSAAEIEFENQVKAEIEHHKAQAERYAGEIAYAKEMLAMWKEQGDDFMVELRRGDIKYYTERKKEERRKIAELKWVLA